MPKVANTRQIAKRTGGEVAYTVAGAEVKLSVATVRNYLVSGKPEAVTEQEIVMFINLCKFAGLNPWMKEAYLIKYGNSNPATMVTGIAAFLKRAERNENYDGKKAGLILKDKDTGEIIETGGFFDPDTQILIGAWCEVYRKDRKFPERAEVSFNEYAGRRNDGSLNDNWSKRPATMIMKVATVHALRAAFPDANAGLYVAEEFGEREETTAPNVTPETPNEALAYPEPAPVPVYDEPIEAEIFDGEVI